MLSRRSLLIGAGTIALAQGLSGCSNRDKSLQILLLRGSIPPQLIGSFYENIDREKTLSFRPQAQLKDLFELLQTWQKEANAEPSWRDAIPLPFIGKNTPSIADLVTLGDYWLESAIANQLIQPLNINDLAGWKQLPPRWQTLVKRNDKGNPDEGEKIWGAPYRWGGTAIAYRQDEFDKLGWTPVDWEDLWRDELRDRISLPDQMREVIGLTLKKLGYSYNSENVINIVNLEPELRSLQEQVKLYSSDRYLEPLVLGDTWLAVGSSRDILSLTSRYKKIKAIIPRSGTALWADVWVRPSSAADKSNLASGFKQWIDFCWQTQSGGQINQFTHAASPIATNAKPEELSTEQRANPFLIAESQTIERCEFLYPLGAQTQKEYETLWRQMRTTGIKANTAL